ncbi:SDR family NAD(P)-dependent oxidoreductase [Rhodococcus sp. ZPP]|uniref:SDR family NAD(P)-dependent oxidoreductase n=1 Tax=Rhodococcus sp. ZPP TaxID=2749906 RepID=UPI001AD89E48|nr:SDR family NAD(P)-dependent oxidoreductase [Rhodococcus sp. ZPP]QTJ67135.1 SDR family NAD(P)-dependent oxidoreductase [Rhodococcus sp. ZPP]
MSKHYFLQDKVVLITGATGGIGAATARELYSRGANLVLTDLSEPTGVALAAEFDPTRVLPLVLDVTDAAAAKAVVEQVVARFGRLDVVFANAGISWRGAPSSMVGCDEDEFERIVEVDFLGVWRTVKAALPQIVANQGQVVVTSSIYAFMNGMVNAPYAASKAAVEMLARALRAELAGTGATASVLYPGWIATPIAEVAFGGNALATQLVQTVFPAPLRAQITPDVVAAGVADGLAERRPRIVVPGRWAPLSLLRGLLAAASDAYLDRNRKVQALVRRIEAESRPTEFTPARRRSGPAPTT